MITLAYGLPGMGKTLLLHDLVKAHQHTHRFFVVEHANDWSEDALHWRGEPPDNLVVLDETPVFAKPEDFEPTGVYVFRGANGLAVAQLVKDIGDACYVDDELDLIARRKGWDNSPLRDIVHQGRHLVNRQGDVCTGHIFGACRRPQNLHTDITDIADQTFIFRVQGSRTLKRLLDDSMIEDEQWNIIRQMEKFHMLHWPSGKFYKIPSIGDGKEESTRPDDEVETLEETGE